mgnify:CR=1 FL=1
MGCEVWESAHESSWSLLQCSADEDDEDEDEEEIDLFAESFVEEKEERSPHRGPPPADLPATGVPVEVTTDESLYPELPPGSSSGDEGEDPTGGKGDEDEGDLDGGDMGEGDMGEGDMDDGEPSEEDIDGPTDDEDIEEGGDVEEMDDVSGGDAGLA